MLPFIRSPRLAQLPPCPPSPAGFAGLECAQLTLVTQAPAPQGRLEVQASLQPAAAAAPLAAARRRRLAMEPRVVGEGQVGAAAEPLPPCGAPLALQLSLPTSQQLASLVWLDGRNRTLLALDGSSLEAARAVAAAAGSAAWLPAPLPLPAGGAAAAALLAPDGRFSRVGVRTLDGRGRELAVEVSAVFGVDE